MLYVLEVVVMGLNMEEENWWYYVIYMVISGWVFFVGNFVYMELIINFYKLLKKIGLENGCIWVMDILIFVFLEIKLCFF